MNPEPHHVKGTPNFVITHALQPQAPHPQAPGPTFEVPIPGTPNKDEVLDSTAEAGTNFAPVIAFLIVAAVVITVGGRIVKSREVRLVAAIALGAFVAWIAMGGGR